MDQHKQTIIVAEIIDIFEKYEISGMDGIAILEFMNFHILQGDLTS